MPGGERGEVVEGDVRLDVDRRRGTAGAAGAAIDPAGGETGRSAGLDVVEEALGHVENLAGRDTLVREQRLRAFEMRRRRLVTPDILGGDDGVEGVAQAPGAVGE